MKKAALLLILITGFLYSEERTLLFLPREDHPFFLNSTAGQFHMEESDGMWSTTMKISTDGDGGNVQVVAHDITPFSLENKNLVIWVKGDNIKALKEFWLYASDSNDFSNRIVFMPSNDPTQLREGVWSRLNLPLSAGEIWGTPDLSRLSALQFWLNDRGSSPLSLELGPVYLESSLPPSAVILTFDDGWKSQIETAAPVMAEQGLTGTAYIIPELIGSPGYMTAEDLKTLTDEYGWSLGSHHEERMDGMSDEELKDAFEQKKAWFEGQGLTAPDFSYANGAFGGQLLDRVKEYYRSGRTIIEYPESNPPGDPYLIKVLNIYPPVNFDRIRKRVENLSEEGELLVLLLHRITDRPEYATEISTADFTELCRLISLSEIPVRTMAQVSAGFSSAPPEIIDWSAPTLLQSASAESGQESTEVTNLSWQDRLNTTGAGQPEARFDTQLDFSLDWKMAWGLSGGDPEYFNQLEDLYVYIQNDLSDTARLYMSVGSSEVTFEDLTRGSLNGESFHLDSLYLEQTMPRGITLTAGYFSPDPHHKWLQVSRSVKLEPAFAQDMTPQYLWIQGTWTGWAPLGIQFAFVPDVIGVNRDGYDRRVLTYDGGEDENGDDIIETYHLGVPNLFTSVWFDTNWLDAEGAVALNGDAVKVAAEGALKIDMRVVKLAGSLGMKYTHGSEFYTYPLWEHENNAWRFSTGLAGYLVLGDFTFNPGYAYQTYISGKGVVRHLYGMDVGFLYRNTEFYMVLTFFDLANPHWGNDAGFEIGYALKYGDVKFVTGYTMGGFSADSGLYNNTSIDGLFLRIKATYW